MNINDIIQCPKCCGELQPQRNNDSFLCRKCDECYVVKNDIYYLHRHDSTWAPCWGESRGKIRLDRKEGKTKPFHFPAEFPYNGDTSFEADLKAAYLNMMFSLIGNTGKLRVLEIGARTCWMINQFALLGNECVAVDICDDECSGIGYAWHLKKEAKTKFDSVIANAEYLPFKDETFDLIVSGSTLHHIRDIIKCLNESYRTLKKGGKFIAIGDIPWNLTGWDNYTKQNQDKLNQGINETGYDTVRWYTFYERSPFNEYMIYPFDTKLIAGASKNKSIVQWDHLKKVGSKFPFDKYVHYKGDLRKSLGEKSLKNINNNLDYYKAMFAIHDGAIHYAKKEE